MVTPALLQFQLPESQRARLLRLVPAADHTTGPSEAILLSRFQGVESYGELQTLLNEQIAVEQRREGRCEGRPGWDFARGLAVGMRLGYALSLAGLEALDPGTPQRKPARRLSQLFLRWRAA